MAKNGSIGQKQRGCTGLQKRSNEGWGLIHKSQSVKINWQIKSILSGLATRALYFKKKGRWTDKYIVKYGQIYCQMWTNIDKYICKYGQIYWLPVQYIGDEAEHWRCARNLENDYDDHWSLIIIIVIIVISSTEDHWSSLISSLSSIVLILLLELPCSFIRLLLSPHFYPI